VYAEYDNHRNLAHIADGLKPSQRKVIYTAIQTLKKGVETKVANLGARSSDYTHYQHGEDSIVDTTIKLAQDFPGSNNMPLLEKSGQFGTMMDNEPSEARYIKVLLHSNIDKLFNRNDYEVLNGQTHDGEPIEPEFFLPVLPLILINGYRGVGNGYGGRILPRNPKKVAEAIKLLLTDKPIDPELLHPSFNGFAGTVSKVGDQYKIKGVVAKSGKTKLNISSLPPDSSFQYENYKNRVLLKLLDAKTIRSFDDDSTENAWNITIEAPMEFVNQTADKLDAKLGLTWNVTENMNCWGWDGKLHMFKNPEDLLKYWVEGRLEFIEKRRLSMIALTEKEIDWLSVKLKFIKVVNANKGWTDLNKADLKAFVENNVTKDEAHYSRLMSLRVSSLTLEEVAQLEQELATNQSTLDKLKASKADTILLEDVKALKF
jgi:DNA topoisomerase-2